MQRIPLITQKKKRDHSRNPEYSYGYRIYRIYRDHDSEIQSYVIYYNQKHCTCQTVSQKSQYHFQRNQQRLSQQKNQNQ